jgi:CxxC-x17-CxxC domain-containing protein
MEEDRKMYPATCSECGQACEVPFEPSKNKPVKCKECYMKSRPQRNNFNRNSGRRFGGRDNQPREMHDATCGECGQKCKVPFKPSPDRKTLCKDCYLKTKEQF